MIFGNLYHGASLVFNEKVVMIVCQHSFNYQVVFQLFTKILTKRRLLTKHMRKIKKDPILLMFGC